MTAAEQLRQQAREQYGQEVALKLLEQGLSIETIKQAINMPTSKLKALQKSIKSKKD